MEAILIIIGILGWLGGILELVGAKTIFQEIQGTIVVGFGTLAMGFGILIRQSSLTNKLLSELLEIARGGGQG